MAFVGQPLIGCGEGSGPMIASMAAHEKRQERATRRAREILRITGDEIRRARLDRDLSQRTASTSIGVSRATWYRIERGLATGLSVEDLVCAAAVVGLDVSVRAFPGGQPIRDMAHVRLLERLRSRLGSGVRWRAEVPLPLAGDRRAWDALISVGHVRIGVEAETRARDAQALERRIALKRRDGDVDHVILLLADTRHNRAFLSTAGPGIAEAYPLPGEMALARLAEGADPGGSAIVLL